MRPFPTPCQRPCGHDQEMSAREHQSCVRDDPDPSRRQSRPDVLDEGSSIPVILRSCPERLELAPGVRQRLRGRLALDPVAAARPALDPQRVFEQPEHDAERQHHREVEDRQQDTRLDVRRLLRDLPPATPAVAGPALNPPSAFRPVIMTKVGMVTRIRMRTIAQIGIGRDRGASGSFPGAARPTGRASSERRRILSARAPPSEAYPQNPRQRPSVSFLTRWNVTGRSPSGRVPTRMPWRAFRRCCSRRSARLTPGAETLPSRAPLSWHQC